MHEFFKQFMDNLPDAGPKNPRRRLNEKDIDDFMRSADARPRYTKQTTDNLRQFLKMKNPWRWRRMQADMAWARKMIKKAGYDPEEIRWLL